MDYKIKLLLRLSLVAICVAFTVIGLGAYTRLINAGLGCPDWPGCYGYFAAPTTKQAVQKANLNYPNNPVVAHKAWAEMVHRYFAGFLSLLIMVIAIVAVIVANQHGIRFLFMGMLLFALVIYQALLGMWTVTLKLLPLVVSQHLLGGMSLLGLLILLHMMTKYSGEKMWHRFELNSLKPWVLLGLLLVFLQITLGAWTSTNYAALSCPNFPFCNTQVHWRFEFYQAFNLFAPIGINYEGGVLNGAARMTIQTMHRIGALVVSIYLLVLIVWINVRIKYFVRLHRITYVTLVILSIQTGLGISNVLFKLPLFIAVAHNLFAALLLANLVIMNYSVFVRREKYTGAMHVL